MNDRDDSFIDDGDYIQNWNIMTKFRKKLSLENTIRFVAFWWHPANVFILTFFFMYTETA